MVIQAHVTSYDEIQGKEVEETCILCVKKNKNCFASAMQQLEDYYGKTLTGIVNIKILSDLNFLVLEGRQDPINEGNIVG